MRYEEEDDKPVKKEAETGHFSRGDITGLVLAFGMLVYSWVICDVPVLMLAISFIFFEVRHLVPAGKEIAGCDISVLLRAFSLTLFVGAVVLLFFG